MRRLCWEPLPSPVDEAITWGIVGDNKIELWLTDAFGPIVNNLLPIAGSFAAHFPAAEYILYLIWMALKGNEVTDIQQGLTDLGLLSRLGPLLSESQPSLTFVLSVAVLRRLVSGLSLDLSPPQ